MLNSPQPVGAFGFPAGLFLIAPGSAEVDAARASLVSGLVPANWPDELRGHELAHADDLEGAWAAFTGDDPVARFNRWVIKPEGDSASEIRAALPASIAPMVDVIAYTVGLADCPAYDASQLPGEMASEVAALVLATQATSLLEQGDVAAAAAVLTQASEVAGVESPALSAVLLGNAGTLLREHGQPEVARPILARAAEALIGTDLGDVAAELLHLRGSIAHEQAASGQGDPRDLLQDAMADYYTGLQQVTEQSAPYIWASLQMNLATAHLASPMTQASDQLRLGVATQALRACRRVFTPEDYPGPWSTATLNLANALIYTPSTHQGDNLVEAVELYEEVLASGVRNNDPLGRARLLANQGNALAHLGIFGEARAKLVEARFLFEEHLDHDSAMAVRSVLDEIAKSEVHDPANADDTMADLARQADQMARMPQHEGSFTSGMGVRIGSLGSVAGDLTGPPPKARVTVLPAGSAPTESGA
jgi:tetratricopeptide (TPR) repeat protein